MPIDNLPVLMGMRAEPNEQTNAAARVLCVPPQPQQQQQQQQQRLAYKPINYVSIEMNCLLSDLQLIKLELKVRRHGEEGGRMRKATRECD